MIDDAPKAELGLCLFLTCRGFPKKPVECIQLHYLHDIMCLLT